MLDFGWSMMLSGGQTGLVLPSITSNLVYFLDPGQIGSYPGSGSTFVNLWASPADGSAQSAYDHTLTGLTFNGSPGGMSANEYFSNSGSGYAKIGANTTFTNSLHKSSAAWTIIAVVKTPPSFASDNIFFGTALYNTSPFGPGVSLGFDSSGKMYISVYNASGLAALSKVADVSDSPNTMMAVAVSINGSGGGFLWKNGAYKTVGGSTAWATPYSSPATANCQNTATLMDAADPTARPWKGGLAWLAVYNAQIFKTDIDSVFTTNLQSRFSL